jgi:lysozyme
MTTVNPLVVDLSHWDPAHDYAAVKADGIAGVIYKATEGQGYTDDTYVQQQHAAKAAGLCWGAYHFADGSNTEGQIRNFLEFACPDTDELFCLDWEDNPSGSGKMSLSQVKDWITEVENELGRPEECVLYGGNTVKEALGSDPDPFLAKRRLWLCQYGSTPSWPDETWPSYWLWQFTDGVYGPTPHSIDGIGPCDINSYTGEAKQLIAEWASGKATPKPPKPPRPIPENKVAVLIAAPPGIEVMVRKFQLGASGLSKSAIKHIRHKEAGGK